ncbi:MAG: GDP-mannose 4,6-dehydratase [Kiritimatiellae bacterium]|nr:GDP-mannose 4,6-dehydratase [Verrucomicrobiota bacterium]MBU4291502.1 GDP-mannose 4,6-dehydratase [Verrucomicrobiota bacterium]MCG2678665.1 GDP-mannose 4,6-dehydratase [Kiritimatiellia bacterium]
MSVNFKKVLVLGSNSFTGSHLIRCLLDNTEAEIVGISRSAEYNPVFLPYRYLKNIPARFRFCRIDLNNDFAGVARLCDEFRPEIIVNYAAQGEVRNSWNWPEQWYRTNCLAVVRVSEIFKTKDYLKKYIAASTPEVYGATGLNIKESHSYYPSTPYAASKLAGDLHLFALHKRHGFPVVFSRTANVYGIHQQLYRIIPRTIIFLKAGKKITLHGRGESRRAFIHARDVADFTLRLILRGKPGEIYHLSPKEGLMRIADVVRQICGMMGRGFDESVELVDENYGQDDQYSLDSTKAGRELGWRQAVPFEEGLKETITWISDNWDFIRAQPLEYKHIAS